MYSSRNESKNQARCVTFWCCQYNEVQKLWIRTVSKQSVRRSHHKERKIKKSFMLLAVFFYWDWDSVQCTILRLRYFIKKNALHKHWDAQEKRNMGKSQWENKIVNYKACWEFEIRDPLKLGKVFDHRKIIDAFYKGEKDKRGKS